MGKSTKDCLWLVISLAAGFAVRLFPAPSPLTPEGLAVLGIFLSSPAHVDHHFHRLAQPDHHFFLLGFFAPFRFCGYPERDLREYHGGFPAVHLHAGVPLVQDPLCPALHRDLHYQCHCPAGSLVFCQLPVLRSHLHGPVHLALCTVRGLHAVSGGYLPGAGAEEREPLCQHDHARNGLLHQPVLRYDRHRPRVAHHGHRVLYGGYRPG